MQLPARAGRGAGGGGPRRVQARVGLGLQVRGLGTALVGLHTRWCHSGLGVLRSGRQGVGLLGGVR